MVTSSQEWIPRLHSRILPRYHGDPTPHHPIDPGADQVLRGRGEYHQRIDLIRYALW